MRLLKLGEDFGLLEEQELEDDMPYRGDPLRRRPKSLNLSPWEGGSWDKDDDDPPPE